MQHRLARSFVGLFLLASGAGAQQEVTIATWNLLHAAKDNAARTEAVIEELRAAEVDVLGLQEVSRSLVMFRRNRARVIGDALGLAWTYRLADGIPFVWDEGPAALARGPIVRRVAKRLVHSRPLPFPGRSVVLIETTLPGGQPFCLASTHLGFGDEAENLEQALEVCELVVRESLARGIPCALVGDLNAQAGDPTLRVLTGDLLGEPVFQDAWAARGRGPGETADPDGDTPSGRIDYVLLLRGTTPALTPVRARLLGLTGPARAASDHRGLVVEARLVPPGQGLAGSLAAALPELPATRAERLLARIAELERRGSSGFTLLRRAARRVE